MEIQSTKSPKETTAERHPGLGDRDRKAIQVVYLDQNAASLLVKANPGTIWQEIREALTNGFRNRKLICPLPFEGMMESCPVPLEGRQSIQALFWQLSEGVAFESFTEMSHELTLALVRPIPEWSPWLIWKRIWAEMERPAQRIKSDWDSAKQRMKTRMDAFVRSSSLEKMSLKELFHAVAAQRSRRICSDLDSLLSGRSTENSWNYPSLVEFLISVSLSPTEIAALKSAVQHHGWARIPIHALNILLGAKWEYDSMRGASAPYDPNDEIDRMRAAVALSHSDLFITEGDMANLCKKAKVNDYSPTLVLSVRDPKKILETVRSIT